VAKACAEGGRKAARAAMSGLVRKAKAAGASFDCDDCHVNVDEDPAQITDSAREKLKRLLDAAARG
jgi:hypothetical protein